VIDVGAIPAAVRSVAQARNRLDLWTDFLDLQDSRTVAEIGVFRGAFAEHVLDRCPGIEVYYMIDPWRHLDGWNKPANRDDQTFERFFEEAMSRTREHEDRRTVLRGTTMEVIDQIPDGSLDFAYVDGDHTLRGITLDLLAVFPKIRVGGWLGGDDFSRTIWQHGTDYEPTLVFPYAVHFAEAMRVPIYGLPHRQFLIEKSSDEGFRFDDLTGRYGDRGLLTQMSARRAPRPDGRATPARSRRVRALAKRAVGRLRA
jgi:hypothetical protein